MFFFRKLDHLESFDEKKFCSKNFWSKNFLSVEPGSGHKGKKFSNFWKRFFLRIGPFRIVWRKNFFRQLCRRATRDRATVSSGWNISGSWKGIEVRFSSAAHKVCFALSDQKWSKSVLYFLRFYRKTAILSSLRGFSGARDFFRGETFFRSFLSIASRFWPKISKI